MADPLALGGRVALVTGATRGIGWATAQLLAAHGASVVLNGRDEAGVAARVAELADTGADASAAIADAGRPDEIRAVYQDIFRQHRRLDILVNNAGVFEGALLGMIADDLLARSLDVNAAGTIHHMQGAARLMGRSGGGAIVNLASIIGLRGNQGQVVYAAAKAAVVGATLSAAKELAPKGIRVNAVAPGFIDTDMTRELSEAGKIPDIGLGRAGTPADVAAAVLFLVSDLSAYVTGQVLGVDGGMVI